jgi:hypothetical protein
MATTAKRATPPSASLGPQSAGSVVVILGHINNFVGIFRGCQRGAQVQGVRLLERARHQWADRDRDVRLPQSETNQPWAYVTIDDDEQLLWMNHIVHVHFGLERFA